MATFTLSTEFLKSKFKEFNEAYFDGMLPMVQFTYSNAKRGLGWYCKTTNTICITRGIPEMTQHDFEEVLIHEMVHAWQNYMGYAYWADGHRGCFITKAREINRKSNGYFHISRCASFEYESCKVQRNTDYVKILVCTKKNDNNIYVGRVLCESRFESWLGEFYEDIKCYEGSGKPLEIFVQSKKHFNYKKMTQERFNEVVRPCLDQQIPFENKYVKKGIA